MQTPFMVNDFYGQMQGKLNLPGIWKLNPKTVADCNNCLGHFRQPSCFRSIFR